MGEPDVAANFFAKPQHLVKVNRRRRMNIWRSGQGSPTVVLAPGFMAVTADWARVQPALARTAQVVSYDHAGQGFSDPGPLPRSPARTAADLKAALVRDGIEPPYVLVGLSMGSFEVRHFAHQYPGEVVGMVLVDPSFDDMAKRLLKVTPSDQVWIESQFTHLKRCELAAKAGDLRPGTDAYAACVFQPQPDLTEALNKTYHDMSLQASYWRSLASEFSFAARDKADWPLADMPLIVLSAGDRERPPRPPEEVEAIQRVYADAHEQLAALSSRGARRVVPNSKHAIQWDRPQAVIDAVREVIAAVCGGPA
ncbi:alpha/beta hydrolase [Phenylobacterium sp.]|uniref:alpha/beta fold hydrolase n=1 Tax=Phenylobacterium sp. TaxID=1871053 RepID=UPI0030F44D04